MQPVKRLRTQAFSQSLSLGRFRHTFRTSEEGVLAEIPGHTGINLRYGRCQEEET